jgi:hypothetical protein
MNEYLTLQGGHILTICIPLTFIVSKILQFLKVYIKNSGHIIKKFNYTTIFLAIISSVVFYIYNWGEYFTFVWFVVLFGSVIQYNFLYRNTEYLYSEKPNIFELIINIFSVVAGIFILAIPHTKVFFMIWGGGDPKVDFVSKILLSIYGILLILLDNHTVLFFNKFIYKTNRSQF